MCREQSTLSFVRGTKKLTSLALFYTSLLFLSGDIISSSPTLATAIQNPVSKSLAFVKRASPSSEAKDNYSRMSKQESSSALAELKETIKTQKAEIDRLRKELSSTITNKKKAIPSGGHAHSSTSDNDEILEYKSKTAVSIASERVGWLAFFLFSLSFTAIIMNGFEHTLSKQIELAYFVPLMAGHGGNTGGQAVGTVLSALSAGVITREDATRVIAKEAMSGFFMGTMLGSLIGPISHYGMGISMHVATVVSVTFPLLSTIAALLGSSLPFVCVMLGLDPAVIAAPAMTSFVDVSGLLCYFLIANKIFRLFGMEL
jgi:cation transporter-like permease